MPRLRLAMIVLLAAALAAAGCSFGDDEPSTAPQSASGAGAAQDRLDLKGVCPDPIVVQTDWFPETEYGVYYHMLGPNPKVDTKRKLVRGPLVVEGQETGVQLEVRSGGPATDFKLVSEQMYTDKSITLGQVNTDEAVRFASNQPTLAVAAPMEISPFMIMWDPETYPQFNIIADIGQTNAKVLYFEGDTYMEYLIGSGILRKGQIDDSYDGAPTKFVAGKGKTTQAGFATSEPYIYANDLKEWNKPLNYALVNDTGYPFYPQALAIRAADKQKLAPCLEKLVPIVQRAQVDFLAEPGPDQRVHHQDGQGLQHLLDLLARPGRVRHRQDAPGLRQQRHRPHHRQLRGRPDPAPDRHRHADPGRTAPADTARTPAAGPVHQRVHRPEHRSRLRS